jgi:diguanylate cyclase (GGDEF)-like protein
MMYERLSLLIVDDEEYILPTLQVLLDKEFEVVTARSADEAEAVLRNRSIDLLLTDQRMPGRSGVQLLEWVRQHSPQTIRLLMTGYSELEDAVEAINRGHVYHYLLKPWRVDDLLQIMHNAADKFRLERDRTNLLNELQKLNRELERRVEERTRELREANLLLEQRARELERLALTDPLTGLLNRRAVEELVRFELKRHARYPSPLALGIVDVDKFKDINTRYLLTGGDEVLKGLARILASSVREVDTVARIGGEEFLILARETAAEGATILAERIRSRVQNTPICYGEHSISLTVSIGFAVADVNVPADYNLMYKVAAAALSQAKATGRNRCVIKLVEVEPVIAQVG